MLAIQASGFSDPAIKKVRKAASIVSQVVLGANGEAAVVAFSDEVKVVQDSTRDQDLLSKTVEGFKASLPAVEARMVDAVDQSLDLLAHRDGARRPCIVLISESRDRGSKHKLTKVLSKLQQTDVLIYGLTYSAYATAFTTKPRDYVTPDMQETPGIRDSIPLLAIPMNWGVTRLAYS